MAARIESGKTGMVTRHEALAYAGAAIGKRLEAISTVNVEF
jgi:hypothetical protein